MKKYVQPCDALYGFLKKLCSFSRLLLCLGITVFRRFESAPDKLTVYEIKGKLGVITEGVHRLIKQKTLITSLVTAAWLAQMGERQSAEREVAGSNPGRTNTQGL